MISKCTSCRLLPIPLSAWRGWRASTGMKMPDCCVLLAAEDADASVATFHDRLVQTAQACNLPVIGH